MNPLPRSSGDLLADRRADYAEMLFANGEHAAAAELMMGAMELAPTWALGWFRLGEFHEAAGALAEATQAWRMCLNLDPTDRAGAGLKLAVAGAAAMPAAPPSDFVEALFDEYAPTFDASLVGKLGYRVPELLLGAVLRIAHSQPSVPTVPPPLTPPRKGEGDSEASTPPSPLRGGVRGGGGSEVTKFRLALDLGCGTGLMGEQLRPHVVRLIGYDISAAMLKKAAGKRVYDALERVDLQELGRTTLKPDLVTAADVLMYVGALDRLFADVSAMLWPGGLFAFSVEAHDGEAYALRDSRRYAHSETYVRGLLTTHGFKLLSLDRQTIRMDRNQPIDGLIVVAGR